MNENIDWNNEDHVLSAVKNDGWNLKFASTRLKNNEEIILEAVKQSGWLLEFASARLRDDKEIVLVAIKQDDFALGFASKRLRSNKTFILNLLMMFRNDEIKTHRVKCYICEELKKELNL